MARLRSFPDSSSRRLSPTLSHGSSTALSPYGGASGTGRPGRALNSVRQSQDISPLSNGPVGVCDTSTRRGSLRVFEDMAGGGNRSARTGVGIGSAAISPYDPAVERSSPVGRGTLRRGSPVADAPHHEP